MIDIAILGSLFDACSAIIGMSFFDNIIASVGIIFWSLPLGFGSSVGAFFFSEDVSSNGYFINSFAPFSDSSMYGLLAMITCFI